MVVSVAAASYRSSAAAWSSATRTSCLQCAAASSSRTLSGPSTSTLKFAIAVANAGHTESSRLHAHRFSTSQRHRRYSFLLSHSFKGKPPDAEEGEAEGSEDGKQPTEPEKKEPSTPKQIGWPPSTAIGNWVQQLLGIDGSAGEDSLMVVRNSERGDVAMGVADGVGSWSQQGVDPALFSQAMMYYASEAFEKDGISASPKELLRRAYKGTMQEKDIPAGSSTASILTLESATGILRSANLGDSGFLVLRAGAGEDSPSSPVINLNEADDPLTGGIGAPGRRPLAGTLYRSAPQQYYFNAPYQLTKYPQSVIDEWRKANPGYEPDLSSDNDPNQANEWSVRLQRGDIVVVASDGVWDNVWGKEWVGLVHYLRQRHREHFAKAKPEAATLDQASGDEGIKSSGDKWEEEKTLVEVIAYK